MTHRLRVRFERIAQAIGETAPASNHPDAVTLVLARARKRLPQEPPVAYADRQVRVYQFCYDLPTLAATHVQTIRAAVADPDWDYVYSLLEDAAHRRRPHG